jgi:hypothetical protein
VGDVVEVAAVQMRHRRAPAGDLEARAVQLQLVVQPAGGVLALEVRTAATATLTS